MDTVDIRSYLVVSHLKRPILTLIRFLSFSFWFVNCVDRFCILSYITDKLNVLFVSFQHGRL